MGFDLTVSVPVTAVFLQGILSFFSPCVLPLLPLYIGYLAGGAREKEEQETVRRARTFGHTLCFVLGISGAFFLLGAGASAAGGFLKEHQQLLARIGGVLVILFGLWQLGLFGRGGPLGRERRLPLRVDALAMSPLTAFLIGFTFSFAWTPCVGPALASVLLMAASAGTRTAAFALIGVYTLGFVLPFLAAGFFTTGLLAWFKRHMGLVNGAARLGGLILLLIGLLMVSGQMGRLSGGLAAGESRSASADTKAAGESRSASADTKAAGESETAAPDETAAAARPAIPAPDFTLTDQFGRTHRLSDYRGKTVFLNFWATWCPPCRAEMPDIQALYEEAPTEGDEALIVLGVATPGLGQETDAEGVAAFLEENGYTYPVLMDETGELTMQFGISVYPTTFMIDRDGNVFGYVSGQLSREMMDEIVRQTVAGKMERTEEE